MGRLAYVIEGDFPLRVNQIAYPVCKSSVQFSKSNALSNALGVTVLHRGGGSPSLWLRQLWTPVPPPVAADAAP